MNIYVEPKPTIEPAAETSVPSSNGSEPLESGEQVPATESPSDN